MPRTLTIPAGSYPQGSYVFEVDNLSNANTDALVLTIPTAGWPTEPDIPVLSATMNWDTGGGATATWNSNPLSKTGAPLAQVFFRVEVPLITINRLKRDVRKGHLTINVLAPSGITLPTDATFGAV